MCDGTYMYPAKGSAPQQITDPLILICGNRDPAVIYPNAYQYIEARFHVLQVTKDSVV